MATISYVIPVWNRPEYLEMVLECLSRQTHIPEQIIIIDDNSDFEMAEQHERLADNFGCEYYFNEYQGKELRLVECFDIGLSIAIQQVICFAHSDIIFYDDYCRKCSDLVDQYSNMVLFHIIYMTPLIDTLKKGIENGLSLFELAHKFGDGLTYTNYANHKEGFEYIATNNYFRLDGYKYAPSYSDNPKPVLGGTIHCDSNIWTLTEQAKKIGWDRNIIGWGYCGNEFGNQCLAKELSIVNIGDIIGYHIDHYKNHPMYSGIYTKQSGDYLEQKNRGLKIPISNPLRKKRCKYLNY